MLNSIAQTEYQKLAIIKKNKCPNVFINASYPASSDWKKNT